MQYDEDEVEHIYLDDEVSSPALVQGDGVVPAVDNSHERQKLKRILIAITVTALILLVIRGIEPQRFVADFTAVFLITFAAMKFADIEAYAQIFSNYDVVAKRAQAWGYILPFILAFMGFWFLLSEVPYRLNVLALLVSGISLLGAIKSFKSKKRRDYAYHKTFLRLPFTRVNLLEFSVVFAMAALSMIV